jgi:hypothetical protein
MSDGPTRPAADVFDAPVGANLKTLQTAITTERDE